jgi:hypothetical protein
VHLTAARLLGRKGDLVPEPFEHLDGRAPASGNIVSPMQVMKRAMRTRQARS